MLLKRGIAPLGMKSLGGMATMVKRGLVTAEQALRYAMSLPVATTIAGIDKPEVLHQNLKVARGFKPMSAAEMAALRKRCAAEAADGRHEMYKVSLKFDNPEARLPHGFPLDGQQKEVKEAFRGMEEASYVDARVTGGVRESPGDVLAEKMSGSIPI